MIALELNDVHRIYGGGSTQRAAVGGVTLRIEQGERVVVLGASGSGKTTLLNLAAGLDRPSHGHIQLLGQAIDQLSQGRLAALRRVHVGFVFQILNLLPSLNVRQNVELPLAINNVGRKQRLERVRELLQLADLENRAEAYPEELSIGQQQRIAALRAVAHRPRVVFMDEPTSALDSTQADRLIGLVEQLNRLDGNVVMVATHDPRIAERFGRTIHLLDGRIMEDRRLAHD